MLLHKTIYIDMWCVLQSRSIRNLTENNTLPQVILTFLYWSKLYQIGRHTTYMNTYTESTSECSQEQLFRKLWFKFFKQSYNSVNFSVNLLTLYKKWDSLQHISRILTRDGAGNFIDQLFFKNTYFPRQLSVAMTINILKAIGNVTVINFQSLTLTIICTLSVAFLEPGETSTMELFCENF